MALFWADYPPECGILRRKALKWGGGFVGLLIAGMVLGSI